MLANAQGLTFNFNHQHELSLAQSNASDAYSLLRSAQNSRLVAFSQQTTVNATIVNVTELLATEASQRRNVVTLQNEVVLQQTRLAQLQQNITAVQVSSVLFKTKLLIKDVEVCVFKPKLKIRLITIRRKFRLFFI
eukprot:Seg2652.3 transcript_id=Seg2652.3/GoldUCD/mRNA.D3Y31 product="hypothetical protein" protein_id=Seg2652.3/GoldUCD/D3Y31